MTDLIIAAYIACAGLLGGGLYNYKNHLFSRATEMAAASHVALGVVAAGLYALFFPGSIGDLTNPTAYVPYIAVAYGGAEFVESFASYILNVLPSTPSPPSPPTPPTPTSSPPAHP